MIYWAEYSGHKPDLIRGRQIYDNTIYTFDIETTSYIILNGNQLLPIDYLSLSEKDKKQCICQSNMYIWMFGINDTVYYGRTWKELELFFERINLLSSDKKKTVFVHNLSWEFQFLRNNFIITNVFARKSRHVIRCEIEKYNLEFRCSYMMSNCSLEKLPSVFRFKYKKVSRKFRLFKN